MKQYIDKTAVFDKQKLREFSIISNKETVTSKLLKPLIASSSIGSQQTSSEGALNTA
jgi:hypothetical protein